MAEFKVWFHKWASDFGLCRFRGCDYIGFAARLCCRLWSGCEDIRPDLQPV